MRNTAAPVPTPPAVPTVFTSTNRRDTAAVSVPAAGSSFRTADAMIMQHTAATSERGQQQVSLQHKHPFQQLQPKQQPQPAPSSAAHVVDLLSDDNQGCSGRGRGRGKGGRAAPASTGRAGRTAGRAGAKGRGEAGRSAGRSVASKPAAQSSIGVSACLENLPADFEDEQPQPTAAIPPPNPQQVGRYSYGMSFGDADPAVSTTNTYGPKLRRKFANKPASGKQSKEDVDSALVDTDDDEFV